MADSCGTADLHPGEDSAGQIGTTQEIPGEGRNLNLSSGPIIDTVVKYTADKLTNQLLVFNMCRSLQFTVTA